VDGRTWQSYKQNLEVNLAELHSRVHRGTYRALPSRRRYIPKSDGRQRPLGIAALEDKIVQRAVVEVLNASTKKISWGSRMGSHLDAVSTMRYALAVGITRTKVNWIVDADIAGFFDAVSHEWLMRFVEHRIGDRRINRLVRKWLKAGRKTCAGGGRHAPRGGRLATAGKYLSRHGNGSLNLQGSSCLNPESFILGRANASPSNTRGGSLVRESRTPGSVRGLLSNEHPYRDRIPLINPPPKRRKATFTLFQASLQDENADCWRGGMEKGGQGSVMGEDSLLERVTAATHE
jgi:Reverse transcriptase (RNA-dependent DNA polymerase)